jgi:hypothetical protein
METVHFSSRLLIDNYLFGQFFIEVEVNLRPTVNRPVRLGVRFSFGVHDQILFSVRRVRVSWYGSPSLTRGRVCNLVYNYFWALPEQSLWGPSPAELRPYWPYCCLIRDFSNLEGQVPVFISPRNRLTQLYSRALGSLLVALKKEQGITPKGRITSRYLLNTCLSNPLFLKLRTDFHRNVAGFLPNYTTFQPRSHTVSRHHHISLLF